MVGFHGSYYNTTMHTILQYNSQSQYTYATLSQSPYSSKAVLTVKPEQSIQNSNIQQFKRFDKANLPVMQTGEVLEEVSAIGSTRQGF